MWWRVKDHAWYKADGIRFTIYQTKHFRLFRIERVYKWQVLVWWKWWKVLEKGRKGGIARYDFQKTCTVDMEKQGLVCERVKDSDERSWFFALGFSWKCPWARHFKAPVLWNPGNRCITWAVALIWLKYCWKWHKTLFNQLDFWRTFPWADRSEVQPSIDEMQHRLNSLPNDKNLNWLKLKAFADD